MAALLLQAALLFTRIDLLPLWDDERFTLQTAGGSLGQIVRAVRADVHPPLYYFLIHFWLRLPFPASALARARCLSALFAIAGTILLYRFWLNDSTLHIRAIFLMLWVASPCLLLYARMARSYTMQMALSVVAIRLAIDWLEQGGQPETDRWAARRKMALYIAAATALLYTHYLPGLAIISVVALFGLWRRQWDHAAALAVIVILYAPWLATMLATATTVAGSPRYRAVASPVGETFLRIAYTFVSFSFGESIPFWAMIAAAAILPLVLWISQRGARPEPGLRGLFLLLAVVSYLAASSWVSFPFVAARLLFLLPFYYLLLARGIAAVPRPGVIALAGFCVIAAGSITSYYRKQDFFNKGYLVDLEQIAGTVRDISGGKPALVVFDRYTSSAGYYLHGPAFPYRAAFLYERRGLAGVLRYSRRTRPPLIWSLHYTRELEPASGKQPARELEPQLETALSEDYLLERHGFVPYSRLDRRVMHWLGSPNPPRYVVEAVAFRRRAAASGSR